MITAVPQADMESINQYGDYCICVITAQNTKIFMAIVPQRPWTFRQQAELVPPDIAINAIKTELIGSQYLVEEIISILEQYPDFPVVLDPLLRSETGAEIRHQKIQDAPGQWQNHWCFLLQ